MSTPFDGRVALITGAGKGLGRAYAHWLAARGAKVVVNNRVREGAPSSAEAVVAEIRAGGGEAIADLNSVETEAGAAAMVEAALHAHGKLDILICNAAISLVNVPFRDLTVEQMREVLDINVWGTFFPLHAAIAPMMDARYGRIVLTTSHIGLYGRRGSSAYGCSKGAVVGLARSVAHDVADRNIRVNVVAPAAYTQLSNALGPDFAEKAAPSKVAPMVGWLCSEACDKSGLILCVGGGGVRRAQIQEGAVVAIEDDDASACWPALDDMTGAIEAPDAASSGRVLLPGERR